MTSGRDRRHHKALERERAGYPGPTGRRVKTVDDAGWMSQFDAADIIGISTARVGLLIQNGRLTPVHNAAGHAGVSTASVRGEQQRRDGAGVLRRTWFLVGDVVRSLLGGL